MKFRITDSPSRRGDVYRGPDGRWRIHPSGRVIEVPPIDDSDRGPAGRDGRDGIGRDGKDAEPAKSFNPRGKWKRQRYQPLDVVTHEGSSYVALASTESEPPSKAWQLLSAAGKDGEHRVTEYFTRVVKRVEVEGSGEAVEQTVSATFNTPALKGMALYVVGSAVDLADSGNVVTAAVVGLASEDVTGVGTFQTEGLLNRADWTPVTGTPVLTPGAILYLAAVGMLSETAPTAGVVVPVGRALPDGLTLDIEIGQRVLL